MFSSQLFFTRSIFCVFSIKRIVYDEVSQLSLRPLALLCSFSHGPIVLKVLPISLCYGTGMPHHGNTRCITRINLCHKLGASISQIPQSITINLLIDLFSPQLLFVKKLFLWIVVLFTWIQKSLLLSLIELMQQSSGVIFLN